MFDKHCDYALNRLDKDAIVCQSITGNPIRLTPDQFSSVEEFEHWKAWSDDDYHKIQLACRSDDDCLSYEDQRDTPVPSTEETILTSHKDAELKEQRRQALEQIKDRLTPKQYRRLWMLHVENLNVKEIAAIEKVSARAIYICFEMAKARL